MRALLLPLVFTCSLAFVACESSNGVVVAPGRPTTGVVVYGSQSDLRLVVNAANAPVTFNSFTVHLLSGENVGGPMVTYPQANLTRLFGSTLIVPGVSRSFVFQPPFVCTTLQPCKILADATFVDANGAPQTSSSVITMP